VGALTEVFVADAAEAADFARDPATLGPAARFDSAELPGVEVVLLAQLAQALRGAGAGATERPTPVGATPASGPWVLELPAGFVRDLAALEDGGVAGTVARWAEAPEWRPRDPQPAVLDAAVRDLARLARTAQERGAGLYLWWSL
jgi:hypothetical protein